MLIRTISHPDNLAVKQIIQQSLKSRGFDLPGTAYFDPQLNDLTSYYTTIPNAAYWVLEINDEIVGGVGIAPWKDNVCELQKLYLKDSAHGHGYGKLLMTHALTFAALHYQACYLETLKELSAACRLYEKCGFALLDHPLPGSEHTAMDAWYLLELQEKEALQGY